MGDSETTHPDETPHPDETTHSCFTFMPNMHGTITGEYELEAKVMENLVPATYNPLCDIKLYVNVDSLNEYVSVRTSKEISRTDEETIEQDWYIMGDINFSDLAKTNNLQVADAHAVNAVLDKLNNERKLVWDAVNQVTAAAGGVQGNWLDDVMVMDKNLAKVTTTDIEDAIARQDEVISTINYAGNFDSFSTNIKCNDINQNTFNAQISQILVDESKDVVFTGRTRYHPTKDLVDPTTGNTIKVQDGASTIFSVGDTFVSSPHLPFGDRNLQINLYEVATASFLTHIGLRSADDDGPIKAAPYNLRHPDTGFNTHDKYTPKTANNSDCNARIFIVAKSKSFFNPA